MPAAGMAANPLLIMLARHETLAAAAITDPRRVEQKTRRLNLDIGGGSGMDNRGQTESPADDVALGLPALGN